MRKKGLQNEMSSNGKRICQLNEGLRDLYLDKVKGLITEADFILLSKDFVRQKSHFEAQVKACESQISQIDTQIAEGDNRHELIRQYVDVAHLTREMVDLFIDKITVGKRISGTRHIPIEIYWNF